MKMELTKEVIKTELDETNIGLGGMVGQICPICLTEVTGEELAEVSWLSLPRSPYWRGNIPAGTK